MFKKATDKTFNLLASGYAYPRGMILEFAKADDNAVREMFRRLFDESLDLSDRVTEFMNTAEELRIKYNDGTWKQHYQNTNYISTYLWLMYPDKYYIYKYELYRAVAKELDDSYLPKKNGAAETMVGGFKMYDEIRKALQADGEIRRMLQAALTGSCYPDPELVTTTIDFGFYVARFYLDDAKKAATSEENWFPSPEEYDPQLSVEVWCALLEDPEVFDENSLTVIQCIYEMGGQATCKELSNRYGREVNFYNSVSSSLAQRIHKKTNCPLIHDKLSKNSRWWPILYIGKNADKDQPGAWVWKLRDELREAYEMTMQKQDNMTAWLLAWNPQNYDWENEAEEYSLDTMFKTVKSGRGFYISWRCVSTKTKCGDTVFFIRLGTEPKGIFASGYIIADSFVEDGTRYAEVLITKAIDFRVNKLISQQTLKNQFPDQQWSPQGSGISIKPEAAKWLIENWDSFARPNEETRTSEPENITSEPVIWKISHGTSQTGIPKHLRQVLEDKKVVVVHQGTVGLAMQNKPQGEVYMKEIKKGDYFFLCYAGEIVLLGQFTEDTPKLNYEMVHEWNDYDWYERPYRLIARSLIHDKYTGQKKIWTSNYNSTCVKVTDNALFEELILQPYFGLRLADLNTAEYHEPYSKADFLKEVFLTEPEYDKLRSLVLRKKNIILQGAPGVGKTFSAKRLAYSIIGEQNDDRICMVQFHQNYSYEDFIMGYRPNDNGGFELQGGVFFNFCERCKEHPGEDYFFIIDEINRGNLSKIFGELLMLIETDKRGKEHQLKLVYGGKPFYIPDNLHIIGMMNTADRSLAMIDYALRRRFSFYTMQPAFENADQNGFSDYMAEIQCELYHSVIAKIRELNDTIRKDSTLGKGFEIGHSYFAPENKSDIDDEWVRGVVEYEIIPLIEEYWFDDDKKVDEWTKALYQVIGDQNDR